jgi:general secretion pathway protein B
MSFILEAIKKSEQQRQQGDAQQQARQRTLAMRSNRSSRPAYWLLTGIIPLVLFACWWFYPAVELPVVKPVPVVEEKLSSQNQPRIVEAAVKVVEPVMEAQTVDPVVKPTEVREAPFAPVPDYTSDPVAQEPKQIVIATAKSEKVAQPVATVAIEQAQPQAVKPVELPFYLDLSRALRDQMPRLAMSMHFYTDNPGRRLVRINDRLLHEGDWMNDDLQVVEITVSGATLDFMGKAFEMRNPGR